MKSLGLLSSHIFHPFGIGLNRPIMRPVSGTASLPCGRGARDFVLPRRPGAIIEGTSGAPWKGRGISGASWILTNPPRVRGEHDSGMAVGAITRRHDPRLGSIAAADRIAPGRDLASGSGDNRRGGPLAPPC